MVGSARGPGFASPSPLPAPACYRWTWHFDFLHFWLYHSFHPFPIFSLSLSLTAFHPHLLSSRSLHRFNSGGRAVIRLDRWLLPVSRYLVPSWRPGGLYELSACSYTPVWKPVFNRIHLCGIPIVLAIQKRCYPTCMCWYAIIMFTRRRH